MFVPGSGLSWRRMIVLADNLPPESATVTAMRNSVPEDELSAQESHPEFGKWSSDQSLLALLVDEVRNLSWSYVQRHSESAVPRPEPLRRPGVGGSVRRGRRLSLATAMRLDPRLRGLEPAEAQRRLDEMTGRRTGNGN